MGGLRYIYGTNNINWEAMSSDSTLFYTNIAGGQQLLFTSNLTLLAAQALTNNAAALQALYPGLGISATANIYTNIWVTNYHGVLYQLPLRSVRHAAAPGVCDEPHPNGSAMVLPHL